MNVLTNILPGLRELRAPLASGYLWLLTAWMHFGGWLPPNKPVDEPIARLWDLSAAAGRPSWLVASSVTAYIIGSFLEIDPQKAQSTLSPFAARAARYTRRIGFRRWHSRSLLLSGVSPDAAAELRAIITRGGVYHAFVPTVSASVIQEVPQLATRLQILQEGIYGKYDRLAAESSFRVNISLPLTLFLLSLAPSIDLPNVGHLLLSVAILTFGVLLARQGLHRLVEANDVIVQAISIKDIELDSHQVFLWKNRLRVMEDVLRACDDEGLRDGHFAPELIAILNYLDRRRDVLRVLKEDPAAGRGGVDPFPDLHADPTLRDLRRILSNIRDALASDGVVRAETMAALDLVLPEWDTERRRQTEQRREETQQEELAPLDGVEDVPMPVVAEGRPLAGDDSAD